MTAAAATTITAGSWQGFLGRGLAERELQCVLGVAQGQSSKELGRDLGIAADTVKKRVASAMFKLQVNRRATQAPARLGEVRRALAWAVISGLRFFGSVVRWR